ncbi:glyoxalase [Sphingobium sp. SCG-1]|uniref:VOC family protein n=1 Tax=Sphingobium sp. SCG-1 TaxID=2072936 RepID=UPI000CD6B190|nr:VOC family protein [Sphingobium sp. SCG-1]AUW59299.1 glyoxalase [Sphingobium sp. SCG-1]
MRVVDIAHVRFAAPDLNLMERFVSDFGMQPFRDADVLYAHGLGPAPYLHMTEKGNSRFVALGLLAPTVDSLHGLSEREGAAVTTVDRPGGGFVVTLTDPDGFLVEVIAGQVAADGRSPLREVGWNDALEKRRVRAVKRVPKSPSHVVRLGHCVLGVSDFRRSEAWYKERFGFITSDEIVTPDGKSIGAFMRCDRGNEPTDHHSLFIVQGPRGVGFNHAAFEILDADDLFVGHEWLSQAGWEPHWGVGRHVLGSQIFDYWRDPWGHALEHWTDGDLLVAQDGSRQATLTELKEVQWGHRAPHAA